MQCPVSFCRMTEHWLLSIFDYSLDLMLITRYLLDIVTSAGLLITECPAFKITRLRGSEWEPASCFLFVSRLKIAKSSR